MLRFRFELNITTNRCGWRPANVTAESAIPRTHPSTRRTMVTKTIIYYYNRCPVETDRSIRTPCPARQNWTVLIEHGKPGVRGWLRSSVHRHPHSQLTPCWFCANDSRDTRVHFPLSCHCHVVVEIEATTEKCHPFQTHFMRWCWVGMAKKWSKKATLEGWSSDFHARPANRNRSRLGRMWQIVPRDWSASKCPLCVTYIICYLLRFTLPCGGLYHYKHKHWSAHKHTHSNLWSSRKFILWNVLLVPLFPCSRDLFSRFALLSWPSFVCHSFPAFHVRLGLWTSTNKVMPERGCASTTGWGMYYFHLSHRLKDTRKSGKALASRLMLVTKSRALSRWIVMAAVCVCVLFDRKSRCFALWLISLHMFTSNLTVTCTVVQCKIDVRKQGQNIFSKQMQVQHAIYFWKTYMTELWGII